MNDLWIAVSATLLMGMGSNCTHAAQSRVSPQCTSAVATWEHARGVGLWKIPANFRRVMPTPNTVALPGVDRFNYDGRTVTLGLVATKAWTWKSPDNYYRLKTRWRGDSLQYLPPFGRWQTLATFDGRVFKRMGPGSAVWTYKKVGKSDVLEPDDRVALKRRALHDYSIRPTGAQVR